MAENRMMREVGKGKDINDGEKISPGEMEMLYFITRGKGNRGIADRQFISGRIVKTLIAYLLEKLSPRDRSQLAIYALQKKLVDPN